MKPSINFYQDDKRLEQCFQKIRESSISEQNKQMIFSFCNTALSEGLSKVRIIKVAYGCRLLADLLQMDFNKAKRVFRDRRPYWIVQKNCNTIGVATTIFTPKALSQCLWPRI